jgi:thymidylate synthase (FAD)
MQTKRLVNIGAEEHMYETYPVLDKGYIKLVDYMGSDETVVAAARHSYDKGLDLNDHEGNRKLIDFLMKNKHTSPFEQPALVFEVKAPIFVFREWHRHRTAKLNEMSARYTVLPNEFYIPNPERIQAQSKSNKQGSGEKMSVEYADMWVTRYQDDCNLAFNDYEDAVEAGLAKEVARIGLPVSTYSKMVWQSDLSNLLHFLRLRTAPTAQWEIRQFTNTISDIVAASFPKVYLAFYDHVLEARTVSGKQRVELARRLSTGSREEIDMYLKEIGVI